MAEISQPSGVRHRVGCSRLGATLSWYAQTGRNTCEDCGVTEFCVKCSLGREKREREIKHLKKKLKDNRNGSN